MSIIEVNTVAPQCGTTLTLGESGDTVNIPAGVTITNNGTQTGFGRTGTVDWQTGSIKTSTFTAVNGQGFFANTTGGAFTCNLPAGSPGSIVSLADYASTWQTHALTVTPNGSDKIGGQALSVALGTKGQSVTLIFVDSTEGWVTVNDSSENVTGQNFMVATGGNSIVTCGNFKTHVFTGPGTFTVCSVSPCAALNKVSYVVVAGGGGGARNHGGAGGAGGFREGRNSPIDSYTASPLDAGTGITVTATGFPITVGAGGTSNCSNSNPAPSSRQGSNSDFSTITSAGGGGGGAVGPTPAPGKTGGAGGSGGSGGSNGDNPGGAGNTPPVSPPQGNAGGNSLNNPQNHAGGGGGATASGANAPAGNGGNGGAGASTQIIGPSNPGVKGSPATNFAGGGGGGNRSGGTGGGGNGSDGGGDASGATPGAVNTGGGGGSAGQNPGDAPGSTAGAGGSGIVMIRYKFQ